MLIDTREQRAWEFPGRETARVALAAGDYSLAGYESRLAVERKSLGDWVNTVMHDWLRFRKELNRLSGYEVACVVVEADLADVLAGRYESDAEPAAVLGRANGVFLDHGIPVFFWGARPGCVVMVERFFHLAERKLK